MLERFFFMPATHTAPAISITAVWSQREHFICQQDQALNRSCKPVNPPNTLCTPFAQPLNLANLAINSNGIFPKGTQSKTFSFTCRTHQNIEGGRSGYVVTFRTDSLAVFQCFDDQNLLLTLWRLLLNI